jgi:hypothetical protein
VYEHTIPKIRSNQIIELLRKEEMQHVAFVCFFVLVSFGFWFLRPFEDSDCSGITSTELLLLRGVFSLSIFSRGEIKTPNPNILINVCKKKEQNT